MQFQFAVFWKYCNRKKKFTATLVSVCSARLQWIQTQLLLMMTRDYNILENMKHVQSFIYFSVKFNWLIHALRMPNGNEEHRNHSFWFIFLFNFIFALNCEWLLSYYTFYVEKKRSFFGFLVARAPNYWSISNKLWIDFYILSIIQTNSVHNSDSLSIPISLQYY